MAAGRMARLRTPNRSNADVLDRVAARFQEARKVGGRHDVGRRIDVRMKRHARCGLQISVENDSDCMAAIVDETEWGYRSWREAKVGHQPLRRRETQLAVANLIGHGAKIGALGVQQDDQVVPIAFLIPNEQIFAVRRVDVRPVLRGRLDGRYGRMLMSFERNTELTQPVGDLGFVIGC